jgi:hypothetical protein
MASGRITIPVGLETTGVKKGAKDAERSLEKLEDAVGDAGKGGARDLDKIEDELVDVQRQSKKTGDDVGRNLDDGFKDAGKEAHSSGKEAAASFSGGFDDVTGFLQETAANAFEGFGKAGAAAGLVAAAGIGLVTAAFEAAHEKELALEEKANDLANAYIEAGTTVLDQMALASRVADIATSSEQGDKDNIRDLTKALGDRSLALRVLAGDTTALATAQGILNGKRDKLDDANFITQTGKRKSALGEEKEAVEDLVRILGDQSKIQKTAKQTAKDYSNALKGMVNDTKSATLEVDEFGNQLYTLPSGVQVVVDAKTGQASTNVENFHGDVDALPDKHVTSIQAIVKPADFTSLQRQASKTTLVFKGAISRNGKLQPI